MKETNALAIAGEVIEDTQAQSAEIGKWIGRQQAFGMIANYSAAAQAQILKRIKDAGDHKQFGVTWDQFCDQHIGMPRRTVDRVISQYEEFGASYFALSAVMRISTNTYRAIAPAVNGDSIQIDGEEIAITKPNAVRIAQAIAEMTKSLEAERDQARGQLSDTKAAKTKLATERDNARKAYDKVREEFSEFKSKETKIFPDATPRERLLLLAQTRLIDATNKIRAALDDPECTDNERAQAEGLGETGIKLLMRASGADPWENLQLDQIVGRDLLNEYTLAHNTGAPAK